MGLGSDIGVPADISNAGTSASSGGSGGGKRKSSGRRRSSGGGRRSTGGGSSGAANLLKIAQARDIDPLTHQLAINKLQSGQFLSGQNLQRQDELTQEKGRQIANQIKIQRGLSAASGAGTSPVAGNQIAQLYAQIVDANRNLEALRQKTYIQNALANQQQQLANTQYLYQQLGLNQAAAGA